MQRRFFYTALAVMSALLVLTGMLYGYSQIVVFFKTGADQAAMMLPDADKVKVQYRPQVAWTSLEVANGRKLEQATIDQLTEDYLAANFYLFENNEAEQSVGLKDYYTRDAREKLVRFASMTEQSEQQHTGTTISHVLTPEFYAEDGTLLVLSDEVVSYHRIYNQGSFLSYYDTSRYDVMLLLEDNNWRIRHKMRSLSRQQYQAHEQEPNRISISGGQFLEDGQIFTLNALNYYPQQHPWSEMWQNFGDIDFANDFKLTRSLGFNAIRIFVQYDEFGADRVDPRRIAQLQRLLDEADRAGLKVIITLFDFFLSYEVNTWTLSDQHLRQVVEGVKNHPALFAWDLKNEPDLDFEQSGEAEVMEWLRFIALRLRTYDPDHLLTVGWSQPEHANKLDPLLDFQSFHFYRSAEELESFLADNAGNEKPLFAGELGLHSYNSWWFPFRKSETDQQQHVAQLLDVVKEYDISYGFWTLYDFRQVPSNVAGRLPWRRNPQKHFGLIDSKGRQKLVYKTILEHNCYEK